MSIKLSTDCMVHNGVKGSSGDRPFNTTRVAFGKVACDLEEQQYSFSIHFIETILKHGAVRSSSDRAVWVRALAEDIVLCSWARLSLLSQCLSPLRCINGYRRT